MLGMDGHIDNLKVLIDEAYSRAAVSEKSQESILACNSLALADESLLKARLHHLEGKKNLCQSKFHQARLRLCLALRHLEGQSIHVKEKFSGKTPEHLNELSECIISFKAHVEWKNFNLSADRQKWFVESVEVFEDALNQLRSGDLSAADLAAYGGLLLHYHLSAVIEDEHGESLPRAKKRRSKLPASAHLIGSQIDSLRLVRQQMLRTITAGAKIKQQWEAEHSRAEAYIFESICAFTDRNVNKMKRLNLEVHKQILSLRQMLSQYLQSNEPVAAGLSSSLKQEFLEPKQFKQQVSLFRKALRGRVEDSEILALRLVAIQNVYDQLHEQYQSGDTANASKLLASAHFELGKLRLIFGQARLFLTDK